MKNINYMCEAIYSDGKTKLHFNATEKAAQNWANRQFAKDENVTVKVYNVHGNLMYTYHA